MANLNKLIAELQDCFPPVNPTPDTALPTIMFRAGQRSVVEYLINKLEEDSNERS